MGQRGRKPGNRAHALRMREVTYEGSQCKRCRGVIRYASNGACVECMNNKDVGQVREKDKIGEARELARYRGMIRYMNEEPCPRCGGWERYTSSGACVVCLKAKTQHARRVRAAVFHSDTSPIAWIHEPPAPELAYLYAMCPTLAAYAGEWHVVYTDAQHLGGGQRLYTGTDVFKRPAALQTMLMDKTNPGHEIARHLAPAFSAAMRRFNLGLHGLAETEAENIANSRPGSFVTVADVRGRK